MGRKSRVGLIFPSSREWSLMPYVEVQCPGGVERVDLGDERLLVGRHHGCQVRRSEPMLSRKHCCIEKSNGGWTLRDLGSRNGTVVNGETATEWQLSNGDNIRVGDLVIRYIDPMEPPRRMSTHDALGEVDPVDIGRPRRGPLDLLDKPLEIDLATVVASERSDENAFLRRLLENGPNQEVDLSDLEFHDGHGRVVPVDHLGGGISNCDWSDLERIRTFRLMLLAVLRTGATVVEIDAAGDEAALRFTVDGLPTLIGRLGLSASRGLVGTAELLCGVGSGAASTLEGDFSVGTRSEQFQTQFQGRFDGEPGDRRMRLRVIRDQPLVTLERLGLGSRVYSRIRQIAVRDSGMLLVAGPRGSGRSTTLHAFLGEIDRGSRRTVAVEENIDQRIDGVVHHRFGERAGESRSELLERITAGEPDVLFIGEIVDAESAAIAAAAARRKHLVHAGIQARDSITAVLRMLELGVESNTLSSSLHVVLAQRLLRRLCSGCRRQVSPSSTETLALGRSIGGLERIGVAQGCASCVDTGYRGRIPIFEMLEIDGRIRDAILRVPTTSSLREAVTDELFAPLRKSALNLVISGETSFEEVDRTVGAR